LQWSSAGEVPGKTCERVFEDDQDPSETWSDNYICWNNGAWNRPGYRFESKWSEGGAIAGWSCLDWVEPGEPSSWNDNYFCWRYLKLGTPICRCQDGFCAGAAPGSQACMHVCAAHNSTAGHNHGACQL